MTQTKGIAIRIDSNLLDEMKHHKLSRNELVTEAIQSYLRSTNHSSKKQSKRKQNSAWTKIEEDSEKLKNISKNNQNNKQEKTKEEIVTDDLYNEIYSTIYNTEVSPLKKQMQLKNEIIRTLQKQNDVLLDDKTFLFDHIKQLETHIPKKHSLFQRKQKK
jgi:lysine/ornithine N-monooxygenase